MNSLRNIKMWLKRKCGGYLLEAAITAPLFFSAVIVLISIIPMVSTCEGIVYSISDEMRNSSLKQYFVGYDLGVKDSVSGRAGSDDKMIDNFEIKRYYQGISRFGMKNVNAIYFQCDMSAKQPFGFNSNVEFEGRIGSRAFNGKKNINAPAGEDEFLRDEDSERVLIFPENGARYHKHGCRYVSPYCKQTYLTDKIRKSYSPCKMCKSKDLKNGDCVFCFSQAGEAYHRGNCSTVKKYYVEVEKHDAEKKGYTPCTLCFGG